MADWLARSEALVQQNAQAGRLPSFYRPDLQVQGAPGRRLPGQVRHTGKEG